MTSTAEHSISRASIRRLAHDVQQRLTKQSFDGAMEELDRFLQAMLTVSMRAASFARRKAISREHVAYAAEALRVPLPAELRAATAEDLNKLQRCNIRAPAQHRKRNAMHAEVSEASFTRVLKKAANSNKPRPRLSGQARRLLHLIAEQRLLAYFSPASAAGPDDPWPGQDLSTADTLCRVMSCPPAEGAALAAFLLQVMNQVPALLQISQTRTVDARLVRAAAGSVLPPSSDFVVSCVDESLVRICDRILRGRAADKRITAAAARELAGILLYFHETCRRPDAGTTVCGVAEAPSLADVSVG